MFKKLLLIILIGLIGGIGYFAYQTWQKAENLSVWSFVPEHTIAVYEKQNLSSLLEHLEQQNSWNTLTLIPELATPQATITSFDSIINQEDGFATTLANSPLLFSLHRTGKNQFDFLLIAAINDISNRNLLTTIQNAYLQAGYRKKNRTYLDHTIIELSKRRDETFAYTVYKNYFIGSYSAFLVEDAIRLLNEPDFQTFGSKYPELFELIKLQKDQGNLYLNLDQVNQLTNDLYPGTELDELGTSSFLDLRINNQSIELDGFAFASDNQWLHILDQVKGQSFDLAEVIGTNTSLVYHFAFEDAALWGANYTEYLRTNQPQSFALRDQLLRSLDIDVSYIYQLLENEVGISITYDANQTNNTLMLEMKDMSLALAYFTGINDRYFNQTKDTVFQEVYRSYTINGFPSNQLPKALMGSIADNYEDCFFTSYRNYLLIGNSLPALKETIDNLEEENTWKKSLRKNTFLSRTNQEAGFSLFINTPGCIRHFADGLNPKWKKVVKNSEYILRSFENIAIQFNEVDNKYFTNILIEQQENSIMSEMAPKELKSITLGNKIISKPHLLYTPSSNEKSILVQDSSYTIYWVNPQFEVRWSVPGKGPLLGKIENLDYFNNGKSQYAFITPLALHIIDDEGRNLPGFPKEIRGADSLTFMSLVDYDGSKNYRFAISDKKGNVFLTDKQGVALNGWNPKSFGRPLVIPPTHYRIAGKDLFVIAQQQGNFHILNRRSREYKGFPREVEDFITGQVNFKPGSTFGSSYLITVTENGTLQSFNLLGETQEVVQLYKPDPSTNFELVNDITGSSFMISRQTENRIDFLNSSQELLFGKDYLPEDELFVQYYNISPAKQYVIVGNKSGQFIYLYDMTGRLITSRPLVGNQPVSMMYYEKNDEQHIYLINDNELTLFRLDQ